VPHLSSLSIRSFRGLFDANLEEFARINLITGLNGAGKSGILEAAFLICAPEQPENTLAINGMRGIDSFRISAETMNDTPWDNMFAWGDDVRNPVDISCVTSDGLRVNLQMEIVSDERELRRRVPDATRTPSKLATAFDFSAGRALRYKVRRSNKLTERILFIDDGRVRSEPKSGTPIIQAALRISSGRTDRETIAERFSKFEMEGEVPSLVESLRFIEPRLCDLGLVFSKPSPTVVADIGLPKRLPVAFLGQGFGTVLQMLIDMRLADNGILLLDEVENGLHHSVMRDVWLTLDSWAQKYDTQIIATTHSLECIEAAFDALAAKPGDEDADPLRVFRLSRTPSGSVTPIREYSSGGLTAALDAGLEVR